MCSQVQKIAHEQIEELSQYEKERAARIAANEETLKKIELQMQKVKGVKIGLTVHVPASVFPDEPAPELGYWVGKTVATSLGGKGDIRVKCDGEDFVFSRSKLEVADWIVV